MARETLHFVTGQPANVVGHPVQEAGVLDDRGNLLHGEWHSHLIEHTGRSYACIKVTVGENDPHSPELTTVFMDEAYKKMRAAGVPAPVLIYSAPAVARVLAAQAHEAAGKPAASVDPEKEEMIRAFGEVWDILKDQLRPIMESFQNIKTKDS